MLMRMVSNLLNHRNLMSRTLRNRLHAREWIWEPAGIILGLPMLAGLCLAQAMPPQVNSSPIGLTKEGQEWVEQTLKGLSLEEKVGQMLQVRAFLGSLDFTGAEYTSVRDQLQTYGIGSVVLGMHFNRLDAVRASPQDAGWRIHTALSHVCDCGPLIWAETPLQDYYPENNSARCIALADGLACVIAHPDMSGCAPPGEPTP
jgi:hypothetical protein